MRKGLNEDITEPNNLIELLKEFFAYREPHKYNLSIDFAFPSLIELPWPDVQPNWKSRI